MSLKHFTLLFLIAFLSLMNLACTHTGFYKNSLFQNIHPAPEKFSPPSLAEGETEIIDDLHIKTQASYHFILGETLSLEGKRQEAIKEFKEALLYDANSSELHLRLAVEYVATSEFMSEAVEHAERALELDVKSDKARLFLASVYVLLKSYGEAQKHYKKILANNKNHFEARLYLAYSLSEQKKFIKSEVHFKKLLRKINGKKLGMAHMYLGKFYLQWAETKSLTKSKKWIYRKKILASRNFEKSLSFFADNEEAVLDLSFTYKSLSQDKKAESVLRNFQDQFGLRKEISLRLINYYVSAKKWKKVLVQFDNFEKFLTTSELTPGSKNFNLSFRMRKIFLLIDLKKYKRAANLLESIVKQDPNLDKAQFFLATALEKNKETERALKHYARIPVESSYFVDAVIQSVDLLKGLKKTDRAIELSKKAIDKKKEPRLYVLLTLLYASLKKHKEAFSVIQEGVKKFPKEESVQFFMGTTASQLKKRNLTIFHMKKVLKINANHTQALNYLAYTYAELEENLDEALTLAKKAEKLLPKDPYILDTVGWIHYKKSNFKKALKFLKQAHKIKPKDSLLADHLGDVYFKLKKIEKARGLYRKALALENDPKLIKKIQIKLSEVEKSQRNLSSEFSGN